MEDQDKQFVAKGFIRGSAELIEPKGKIIIKTIAGREFYIYEDEENAIREAWNKRWEDFLMGLPI
jgi:hypothetical protein